MLPVTAFTARNYLYLFFMQALNRAKPDQEKTKKASHTRSFKRLVCYVNAKLNT